MIRVSELSYNSFPDKTVSLKGDNTDKVLLLDNPSSDGVMLAMQYMARIGGVDLVAAYWPGARMDKPGLEDTDVTAQVIAGSNGVKHIHVIDPHSTVTETSLTDKFGDDGVSFYRTTDIVSAAAGRVDYSKYTAVIAPDHGAADRATRVAEMLDVPVAIANKVRNQETGRIVSYSFDSGDIDLSNVLVVDDICDGGATFGILRSNLPGKADLQVSHGLFTGRAETNLAGYDRVISTDSLPSATEFGATIIPVEEIINVQDY